MALTALAAGHTDSVLSCTVLPGPKLLASGGEDGAICFTDLSSLKPAGRLAVPPSVGEAVPSLCGHPGEEHTLFAAAGSCVLELDLRAGLGPAAVRRCFAANADEVNCVAASAANGGWLAAADDSGEMQVISLAPAAGSTAAAATEGHTGGSAAGGVVVPAAEGGFPRPARPAAYKTLRRGHSNIAAAAAFRPHRPWELLSGGLDSTVVKWDFSRLRPLQTWNLAGEATASGGQLFNPPMVHCLAVPQTDDRGLARLMAVARGDGCVSLYDADWKQPAASSSSGGGGGKKGKAGASGKRGGGGGRQQVAAGAAVPPGRLALLGREQGGHSAAVNCVAFLPGGRQLLSAGNDCRLLLWNLGSAQEQQAAAAGAAAEQQGQQEGDEQTGGGGASLRPGGAQQQLEAAADTAEQQPLLAAEHQHARKINWVCTADVPGCSFNAFVADTGRRLTALTLAP